MDNKIVNIKTHDAESFRIFFELLGEIITYANISFIKDSGLQILETDTQKTRLIYVKMNSNNFSEFNLELQNYKFGLDILNLNRIMRNNINEDSYISISVNESNTQNIEFNLENNGKNTIYRQESLDLGINNVTLPNQILFDFSVSMLTSDFRNILRDVVLFSQYVEIICTKEEITISSYPEKNIVKKIKNGDDMLITFNDDSIEFRNIYYLPHLLPLCKSVRLTNQIHLLLKNNNPMFVKFSIANLGKMLFGICNLDSLVQKKNYDNLYKIIDDYKEEIICPISQEKANIVVETKCQHRFDKTNLIKWLEKNNTCPLCREELK